MATGTLQSENRQRLIAECKDFGLEYNPSNPLYQTFQAITQKTYYPLFKIWALQLPTDNPDLEFCARDEKLQISKMSPDALERAYLAFNQAYCLGGENMQCDDPHFTFSTIHTPAMEALNRALPPYRWADHQYDFDDIGHEYNHYLDFKGVLQRAAKYDVDTTAFEKFIAETFLQTSAFKKKTIVVNLFAGPGAGKTTCAWEIASELKKRGIEAEYVSEYAKEFVWDGRTDILDGSLEHQQMLFTEQAHRINRLIGKVDVVVTDSPTVLGLLYLKEANSDFEAQVLRDFNGHKNFNLFINRGQVFQQAGRIHNVAESKAIDKSVLDFLQAHQIYYGTYYHSTVGVLVNNIITNLANVNQKSQKRSTDCPVI